MSKYIAIVRNEKGNITNVKDEYNSKKDFASDLRANGYSVLYIYTEEQVSHIKETDYFDLLHEDRRYDRTIDTCYEYIKECL